MYVYKLNGHNTDTQNLYSPYLYQKIVVFDFIRECLIYWGYKTFILTNPLLFLSSPLCSFRPLERHKISQFKFKVVRLLMTKDIASQSRITLQTFVWWGGTDLPPTIKMSPKLGSSLILSSGVNLFWLTFLSQKLNKQRKGLFA